MSEEKLFCYKCLKEKEVKYFSPQQRVLGEKVICFECEKNQGVTIFNTKPPIYDAVCQTFEINPGTTVFTYGDTIYNPAGAEIPDHVIEHEKVHMKQQLCFIEKKLDGGGFKKSKMTPELWWGKFLREPKFRIDQEARACAKQYLFICKTQKDRNQRARTLHNFAIVLSGKLYGEMITHQEAIKEIKKFTGNIK